MQIVLTIVATIVIGFIASEINAKWKTHRAMAFLSELCCPSCHEQFGLDTANAASHHDARRHKDASIENAEQRNGDVREWIVTCSRCHTESYFAFDKMILYPDPTEGRDFRREVRLGLRREDGALDVQKAKAHIADQAERCLAGEITYHEFTDAIPRELNASDDKVQYVDFYLQHMSAEKSCGKETYRNERKEAQTAIDHLRLSIKSDSHG